MKRFEKLAELRKASGFSQDELAEQLGVSRQSVSRWETGQAELSPENLRAMCALYQVSADYLLLDGVTLKKGKLVTDGTVSGEESKECLEETPAEEKPVKTCRPRRWVCILLAVVMLLAAGTAWWYTEKSKQPVVQTRQIDLADISGTFELVW